MKAFTEYLKELSFYEDARRALMAQKTVLISGCADAQKAQMLCGQGEDYPYKLVLTFSDVKAKELYEDYSFFDKNTILFPAKDYIFFQADIRGQEMTKERICCYRRILEKEPLTIVTTVDALLAPCLPLQMLEENCITISAESIVEEEAVAMKLVKMGYEKTYQVEEPGQFSVRGGIIDIYDLTEENPYRIELWGDEVESIRRFDVLSQRSVEALRTVTIYPATEMILTKQQKLDGLKAIEAEAKQAAETLKKENKLEEAHRVKVQTEQLREQMEEFGVMANLDSYMKYFCPQLVSFLSLFPKDELLVTLDEPLHGKEHLNAVELEFRESMEHRLEKGYALPGQAALLYTADQVWAMLTGQRLLLLSVLDSNLPFLKVEERYYADARAVNSFQNSFEILLENLRRYHKNRYRVILLSPSRTRAKRLAEDICANELTAFYSEDTERVLQNGEIMVMHGQISKGFEYPSIRLAVITESDIFGKHAKKRKKKRYEGQKIHDFTELKVGDYVVHETHGLGIYRGIEKVCVDKVMKDYMKIEYRDGGTLYVLATGFDAVMKYASAESKAPKLNKLGTQEWTKTKSKVKGAVNEVAKDLVKLYAAREHGKGYQYGKDTVWQREFEEMFPYEETQDQLLAIDATKADMESGRIMDRLICGDVGYGKTEVAIRAAFKAVQEGKQVVFLVPTTILAKQHYDNFVQRMKDFPVTIEMMSRFRTAAQQKKTIEGLKKGLVDIVIGTHRVLSKDVAFKDLGLLIIDEEQRFGVTHKEKIKQLKENVDVLTLTATPIPLPEKDDVYNTALSLRPEIEAGKLNVESSDLSIKMARAGYLPTLNLSAGIGSTNANGSDFSFSEQVKQNWNNSLGLTLSIPIFDKRQTKSSINKAKLQKQTSQLDLLDNKKTLYKTIENLWLAANSAQQQYVAASQKLKSTETSYSLVSEQFNVGMKNTVELLTEKNNLLSAQQETLQAKYTAILNAGLLRFYQGEEINLF